MKYRAILIVVLILLNGCIKNGLERRNDFSESTYLVENSSILVTLKGSRWIEYQEGDVKVSEWVGPYRLFVAIDQPSDKELKIAIRGVFISKSNVGLIESFENIQPNFHVSAHKDGSSSTYLSEPIANIEPGEIVVTLEILLTRNGIESKINVPFFVEPKIIERSFNIAWAELLSV